MTSNFPHTNSLPGPDDITRTQLPNGIILLTRANFNSPSVYVSGYFVAGSLFDNDDKLGLANFTAMSLMRGTQQRTFQQIYDALESSGASLGFGASTHNVSFAGRALAEDLPLILQTLTECIQSPAFPEDQVERLRVQILTNLAIRAQDTSEMAYLAFDRAVFGNHPYGRSEDGYPETIQNITRADLAGFHDRHYTPPGLVIAVVGAVPAQQALEEVQKTLGAWQASIAPRPDMPPVQPVEAATRQHITIGGKSQTDLVMGCQGPKRESPDYLAAALGNSILGQFGLMGRIGDVVREKAGLAYSASTHLNAFKHGGAWTVSAGVNPSNLQRAIDLIIQELQRFTREPVKQEELQDSQSSFVGSLPISLESNRGVANALLKLERYQLGLDYYRRYPGLIGAVTQQDVLEAARRYLDLDRLCTISAGS